MRLLFIITYYVPHLSGLTRSLQPIVTYFQSRGDVVEVLAAKHSIDLPISEMIDGAHVTRVPVWRRIGKGLLMPRHIVESWRAVCRADIVTIVSPQFDAGPTALIARLCGRPVIMSYVCSFQAPGFMGKLAEIVLAVSHVIAGLCATKIVAVSKDYASQSRYCKIFAGRLTYIPPSIPFYPEKAKPSRPVNEHIRIGFVGRISVEKNIQLLLDVIPLLRQRLGRTFSMELVGPVDHVSAPGAVDLQRKLAQSQFRELLIHGKLTEAALDSFYSEIDVLVLPSVERIEAYGMVQVEAMLRGTPCVTSDRPGMRDPINLTGFGLVFEPGNVSALADALCTVLRRDIACDPKPESIHSRFHPNTINAAWQDIFEAAQRTNPRHSPR